MNLEGIKGWKSNHLTCVSGYSSEVIDWLIAKVERLTRQVEITSDQQCPICCKSAPNDAGRIREVESERDRYKAALDEIASLTMVYDIPAVWRIREIAEEAMAGPVPCEDMALCGCDGNGCNHPAEAVQG